MCFQQPQKFILSVIKRVIVSKIRDRVLGAKASTLIQGIKKMKIIKRQTLWSSCWRGRLQGTGLRRIIDQSKGVGEDC